MMSMKLVWDKSNCTFELDGLTVVVAPRAYPPFTCDAIVEEQDTHLTLSEQTVLKDPGKPSWYLAHTLERDEGHSLGSVIVSGKSPLRLTAVAHNLDQEPTCTPESIKQAYKAIMDVLEERKLTSLALPLLGTVHGKLPKSESIQLLRDSIRQGCPKQLQRIWLILPADTDCDSASLLSQLKIV